MIVRFFPRPYKRVLGMIATFTVLMAVVSITTNSCVVNQRTPSAPVRVLVNVNLPDSSLGRVLTEDSDRLGLFSFASELKRLELKVYVPGSPEPILTQQTTNVSQPNFSFELQEAGIYRFEVEGFDATSGGNKIITGQKVQSVSLGANNVLIQTTFVPGSVLVIIEISETVWERYNVSNATLALRKESETSDTVIQLNFASRTLTSELSNREPGMWRLNFGATFTAKQSNYDPQTASPSKTFSTLVRPSATSKVKFVVDFQSGTIVVNVQSSIEFPFINPVGDLKVDHLIDENALKVTWSPATQGATYYVYKIIEASHGGETFEQYELAGTTDGNSVEISNYTSAEHGRIKGVAVNAVKDGKESGLVKVYKADFLTWNTDFFNQNQIVRLPNEPQVGPWYFYDHIWDEEGSPELVYFSEFPSINSEGYIVAKRSGKVPNEGEAWKAQILRHLNKEKTYFEFEFEIKSSTETNLRFVFGTSPNWVGGTVESVPVSQSPSTLTLSFQRNFDPGSNSLKLAFEIADKPNIEIWLKPLKVRYR